MKRLLITAVVALALMLSVGGSAMAADHSVPGTPGTANCQGQTTAYLAQAAKNGLIVSAPGLGNLADTTGLSVQQIHDIVAAYCK